MLLALGGSVAAVVAVRGLFVFGVLVGTLAVSGAW
jgi:hypothetical protein